jgi:histone-lysine N-methyltransferase SETMAR
LNATATTKKICDIYGDVLEVRKCQRWFKKFAEGDLDLSDAPRSGRPVEFDNETLKSLIESDPKLTIEELSQQLGSTRSTVHRHLEEIGKVHRVGKWVPHELSSANKEQRIIICNSLLTKHNREPFLRRIVTGDEKWVLYSNLKRTKQWLSPNQTPVPTPKPSLTLKKCLLCVWWDFNGVIHFELLKPGETITAEVYCQQLERLQQKLSDKRPALINRKGVILQHDNARPHAARITQEKIKELGWEVLPHPPYSPDIAPSDYHLFRSLEHSLAGKKFQNVDEVKNHLESFFSSKKPEFFKRGIESLETRWQSVIDNNGDYIIG